MSKILITAHTISLQQLTDGMLRITASPYWSLLTAPLSMKVEGITLLPKLHIMPMWLTQAKIRHGIYVGEISLDAYPNPYKEFVTFRISLEDDAKINLSVYDVSGRKLTTLKKEMLMPELTNSHSRAKR